MSWQKIRLVMLREYLLNFKRPSFLFTAFGVPLMSLGAMFLIIRFTTNRETNLDNWQRVGYVDRAGVIDAAGPNPDGYQPVSDPALAEPTADADPAAWPAYYDALETAARQQLIDDSLDAYFVLPAGYTLTGQVDLYARKNLPEALRENVQNFLAGQIAAKAPDTLPVPVERLHDIEYTVRDLDTGKEMSEAAMFGRLMLPFIFVLLYFMATNTTAQFLMSGVVEEKENRLMEILATSLRPIELLWGKLLGLGALALTQVIIWAAAGLLLASQNEGARDFISGAEFQAGDIALIVGLFVINFLLFSAIMLGIGASVTAEAESRQVAGIFTVINVLPLALLSVFITNPDGALAVFFTLFPLTAATGLILRLGLTTIPLWQMVLSIGGQVVSVLVVVWLSAKIFRLGMLMYGKPLTPRALFGALREGRVVLTTAAGEQMPVKPSRQKKGWFRR